MEHPPSQQYHHLQHQLATQVGQHQFPPLPVEDGHTHQPQLHMVRRSISHQDVLGRFSGGSGMPNLPPDLERLTMPHARSTENIAVIDNNVKYNLVEDADGAGVNHAQVLYQDIPTSFRPQQPTGNLHNSGRIRMPFPPVPKLDQMPVSMTTVSQHPPSSGFGSITASNQVSQPNTYPPLPQVYPNQEDQGWRIPQYKRRTPAEVITSQHQPQGGYPPSSVTNVLGPPQPPHHSSGNVPHYYQAHGQGHGHLPPHAAHGQLVWNNRENRFESTLYFLTHFKNFYNLDMLM